MLEKDSLVAIRDIQPADRNFILATWLRGLRFGNDWFQEIEKTVYFTVYQQVVDTIISDSSNTIKVACLKEDPEVILGYSVYAGERLDWVFVKKAWRGIGIAKSLIPSGITTVSHLTKTGKSIMHKSMKGAHFNPFSIR